MRTLKVFGLVLMFVLAGTVCAEKRATTAAPGKSEVDVEKVAVINRTAHQRGVRVIWVHMPKKKDAIAAR